MGQPLITLVLFEIEIEIEIWGDSMFEYPADYPYSVKVSKIETLEYINKTSVING